MAADFSASAFAIMLRYSLAGFPRPGIVAEAARRKLDGMV
jgi:hypothetical protein